MKTYILDGHNILHGNPALRGILKKDHGAAQDKLLAMISGYARRGRNSVIVVFDGSGIRHAAGADRLRVVFADKGKNADQKMKDLISGSRNPKLLCVVTHDREVLHYAKLHCSETMSPEQFLDTVASRSNNTGSEKPFAMTETEKQEWLDIFSLKRLH